MYSEQLVIRLNDIARDYKEILRRSIQDVLAKYQNTGKGVASVRVTVIPGDAEKAPAIQITFDDYLIVLDKRRVQWTKLPDMKKLEAWARTKEQDDKKAKQLAWAVAWRQKKFDKWKPKTWRKKSLSGALREMNERILKEFDQAIDEQFQQATKV